MNYCVYSDPEGDTTVYAMKGRFEITPLYTVKGWHRSSWVSSNGRYFVAGYSGLNLVPTDVSPEQTMVTIYDNGVLIREVKLRELFNSLQALRPTASHYEWGYIDFVADTFISLITPEGEVIFDIENDKIYLPDVSQGAN